MQVLAAVEMGLEVDGLFLGTRLKVILRQDQERIREYQGVSGSSVEVLYLTTVALSLTRQACGLLSTSKLE